MMNVQHAAAEAIRIPESVAPRRPGFLEVITHPRVDRAVAIVACLPFVYVVHHRLATGGVTLPWISMAASMALLIATMLVRRPPVRVTTKSLYWATAFFATYWGFLTLALTERGIPVAPSILTDGLAIASLVIAIVARVSLGRNIGFVPAQRELVSSGAYAFVRHPIYTGLFVSLAGFALRAFSPLNLLIIGVWATLFVVKTFMEERFLGEDPAYARYTQRVHWRWLPGIA